MKNITEIDSFVIASHGMHILGISIDKPFLRVALIEKKRKRSEVLYLKSIHLNEPENVKQLYTASFKQKIYSSLPTKNTLSRPLEINTHSSRHLEKIIAFQSETMSHFNPAEVLSCPYFVQEGKDKTDILLFTASREGIKEHLQILERLKIDPDCVSATPLALVDYISWKIPHLKDVFIVDLGSEEWTALCMEKGELKKFHSIDGGTESLLNALWEDRKKILFSKEIAGIAKQIDLLQLKATFNSHLSSRLIYMQQELSKVIYSFSKQYGAKPVLFTGRVDAFGQMQEYLKSCFGDSILLNDTLEIPKDEQKYATSIGLAIGEKSKKLQFRSGEFFPKKNWKKAGVYSLIFSCASLCIGIGLIGFSNTTLKSKKQEMVGHLHATLSEWDKSLTEKIFVGDNEEEILNRWNKAVATHSKEYPFLAKGPKVSEVLSWIYQHPIIQESKREVDPIEVNYVHYQLLQYPQMDAPKDPYQAKIEIEFKTKSPLIARKLHESLYLENGWVDSSQEIHWEATDDLYRVSFFLNQKIPHAP
jgi:hypothetical protein